MGEETIFERARRIDAEMSRWVTTDPESVAFAVARFNATHKRIHARLRSTQPKLRRTIDRIDAFLAITKDRLQAIAASGEGNTQP
jgi:hypothetical protein